MRLTTEGHICTAMEAKAEMPKCWSPGISKFRFHGIASCLHGAGTLLRFFVNANSVEIAFLGKKADSGGRGNNVSVECPSIPVGNCKDSFGGNPGLLILSKGHHWLEGQGIQGECELAKGHHQRVHHLKMPNTT